MSLTANDLWAAALSIIRSRVTPQQYETWFKALKCTGSPEERDLVLEAPNAFCCSWLKSHYLDMMEQCLASAAGSKVALTLTAGSGPGRPAALPRFEQPRLPGPPPAQTGTPLNRLFLFDTFVVGPCNALAHAAAVAVSDSPGTSYNPLFLHSSVGMGKTHLLQACCHRIREKHPGRKILYLSCESFVNQFIAAVERGELESFRYNYRYVDVLVIDDIHFLANKERTQEEFFHTFNTLYHSQKQIILSSDSPPKEIPSLKERLVTRFKWGLVVKLEQPEFETRVAIIRKKAKLLNREIPTDVVEYVAAKVTNSVRELEGAVVRVLGTATLTSRPVNMELATETLGEVQLLSPRVGMSDIQEAVAARFNVKVADLQGRRRHKSIAFPRQICMFLAKELTSLSLVEIGGYFSGRDHSTVLYAIDKIKEMVGADPSLAELITQLREVIGSK
jgi:chromosomal replication initiator protein